MVKVGDKIRILHDNANYAVVKKGDVFTVDLVVTDVDVEDYIIVGGPRRWSFRTKDYEVISQFKKGDRVIIRDEHNFYNNEVGIIVDIGALLYGVRLDAGIYTVVSAEQISYYAELEMQVSPVPPEKITQNGYEYSLVGPVKPEWLVDGVWVVGKIYGTLFQVIEGEKNNFSLRDNHGRLVAKEVSTIVKYYRPHEPKDWKWGDWAMYEGKRVFVMCGVDGGDEVGISFPNVDEYGYQSGDKNWNYVSESRLTPTF